MSNVAGPTPTLLLLLCAVVMHVHSRPHHSDPVIPACGNTVRRTCSDSNCSWPQRSYLLRMPSHDRCTAGLPLPVALAIHCFGCSENMEITKFAAAADRQGIALVAPAGMHHSWNAPHCCGNARQQQLDDVGFIDALVADLLESGDGRRRFDSGALFATGFSNGGFLTSQLAEASRRVWAGIAPTAGHEYHVQRTQPLPVAIHHCVNDHHVNMSGCCRRGDQPDSPSSCCCGIAAAACVSTQDIFERWLKINRCRGKVASLRRVAMDLTPYRSPPNAVCQLGRECVAETWFCVHQTCTAHQDWVSSFPGADAVMSFFARRWFASLARRADQPPFNYEVDLDWNKSAGLGVAA